MPVPAHRHTKSKVRRRRSHDALKAINGAICPNCGAPKKPHLACANCGFYKGKQVVKSKADVSLKREEKRKKQEAKDKEKMQKLKNS